MPCIFAGDLNAKSPVWSTDAWNTHGFTLNDALNRCNLTVLKTKPTRIDLRTSSRSTLDVWIVNKQALDLVNRAVIVGDRFTSDHFVTLIRCRMPFIGRRQAPPAPVAIEPRHDISKANRSLFYNKLRDKLLAVRVPQVGEPVANLTQYREEIIHCIKQARDDHVPIAKKHELKLTPMSREMRDLLARKRILERA